MLSFDFKQFGKALFRNIMRGEDNCLAFLRHIVLQVMWTFFLLERSITACELVQMGNVW